MLKTAPSDLLYAFPAHQYRDLFPPCQGYQPVKASNGTVKARAKDVRAEVLDGSLKLYLTYEFSGVKDGGT